MYIIVLISAGISDLNHYILIFIYIFNMLRLFNQTNSEKIEKQKTQVPLRSQADLRLQQELSEIDAPYARLEFTSEYNLKDFNITINVTEATSYWFNAHYNFHFEISDNYPYEPPKVKLTTKIFHPNIDYQGNINLNILRSDWRPILSINLIIYGLHFLFSEPNPNDCINQHAGYIMRNNKDEFKEIIKQTLNGGEIYGEKFLKLL